MPLEHSGGDGNCPVAGLWGGAEDRIGGSCRAIWDFVVSKDRGWAGFWLSPEGCGIGEEQRRSRQGGRKRARECGTVEP
jgi:hypothetical protein